MLKFLIKNYYKYKKKFVRKYYFHRTKLTYGIKINKIYEIFKQNNTTNKPGITDIKKHKEKWSILDKNVNTKFYEIISKVSGKNDINIVPEDIYYGIIEPSLNNYNMNLVYSDKNFYDNYYSNSEIFPKVFLRNINGIYYDRNYEYTENNLDIENYFQYQTKLIVKPSLDTGGGINVQIFYKKDDNKYYNKNNEKLTFQYLDKNYKENYLIQEFIESSTYFKQFNETSLNTIKVFTYRSVKDNSIIINNCVLRIGKEGAELDNETLGGISCFIHSNGKLNDFAVDKYGNKYFHLPHKPDFKFSNCENLPQFDEIKIIAEKIAKKNYYFRLIGFDFCIDSNNKIRLIELNYAGNGISFFQMPNATLFGENTDEIIKFCKNK